MPPEPGITSPPLRAWYGASISDFLNTPPNTILGEISKNCTYTILPTQKDAWIAQIDILQKQLKGLLGYIFFEFNIPRMGRRVDVVLITGSLIFVLEFKIGETNFDRVAINQVWDYALDLKNFHQASHEVPIIPILISTDALSSPSISFGKDNDNVLRPLLINSNSLRNIIDRGLKEISGPTLDAQTWVEASYQPTPTIIEAARALYAQHSVEAITRFDAGAQNLNTTSHRIEELVNEARNKKQKYICFLTGVPGAGKTLVGLNIATKKHKSHKETNAVFLSGNGPLVAVLREALTRDEYDRRKLHGERMRKGEIGESVKVFIQNIHHFRDDGLIDNNPPTEHVVIFDEAQRAWNLRQTSNFMRRKKGQPNFSKSEPEFLISYMDRHQDWAIVICLVGGGQEINIGEAGIEEWLNAIHTSFPHWKMFISSRLVDAEYAAGNALEIAKNNSSTIFEDSLHLAVSMRSFRAENVSAFVKALLDCKKCEAKDLFSLISPKYPIAITRDLKLAKTWLRKHARGSERYGMIASSKAMRLKPHAVDIRVAINPIHYFLNDSTDTRSSYYLEDAATEFQVQGLELDWVCLTWDADLRFRNGKWNYHDFRGTRWCNIRNTDNQNYLQNAYRVLLTRARQGMVIFIPPGDASDPTRSPDYYNSTFDYLSSLGIPKI